MPKQRYLCCLQLNTNLTDIAAIAQEKDAENLAFRNFLKSRPSDEIDQLVQTLDQEITPRVDCTACGNCCNSLMVQVLPYELTRLATHLDQPENEVKARYIETGSNDSMMLMNQIPCHFLKNKCCTIYEQRFEDCRVFPGLHLPQFTNRLFSMFAHYDRCPIIFNVMEEMKGRLGFV
ncbi:YkgJ family cysteine cluster protein [Chitinophaga horti]|uniref:YkgJ family cysteine cluster protein n=1 Tax=Chitinophaga horti TaxID=2920382 RepID=A0ABY6IWM2_9BACT|nr:YkgJ family cysteine cluster protein [Chitinophaga horti]UYQ91690.1 YkgJ family cysteine cluster protein [Chitinophaga horti]